MSPLCKERGLPGPGSDELFAAITSPQDLSVFLEKSRLGNFAFSLFFFVKGYQASERDVLVAAGGQLEGHCGGL